MSKRKIILVLAFVLLLIAVILSYWVVGNRIERKKETVANLPVFLMS